ncbi:MULTISPECIES: DUF3040 domain-containing protein [unclassified Amycolatopsis]|uniref:DUF3040 domain-containing protein n=1 Tax=unclassified Amycolatopsis TaxID=2618356 RepID=UPI002E139C10|nr:MULTISPECIES: DUF3040 domain-containing protein [unclassified Amycolatopsis]WSJ72460.1 DUF3040 domain-containing protein [Amycolatopsis sp. NBC_01307]WSK74800.1 DUF3040 domain-containing protein [Amycolatopsis sp. NBC_01286]
MPLSEHEQRLLDQIERELYAEDPKFASTVRGTRLRRPARRRRIQGIALFVVGVALLVLGVVVPQFRVADIPLISVLGFLVMFFGVMLAVTSIRHGAESDGKGGGPGSRGGKQQGRRSSFTQRMEERFRQRFEEQ